MSDWDETRASVCLSRRGSLRRSKTESYNDGPCNSDSMCGSQPVGGPNAQFSLIIAPSSQSWQCRIAHSLIHLTSRHALFVTVRQHFCHHVLISRSHTSNMFEHVRLRACLNHSALCVMMVENLLAAHFKDAKSRITQYARYRPDEARSTPEAKMVLSETLLRTLPSRNR